MTLKQWLNLPLLDDTFPLPLDAPFTTSMAAAEGVSADALRQLRDHCLLRRPVKGVHLAAQAGDSVLLRAKALSLVVPAGSVVCDRHAAWLAGAEMVLAPNEHLELQPISMFRRSGHGRLRNGLCSSGERNLIDTDLMEVHGLLITTPLRTAWDLGRLERRDRAFAGLDSMLRLGVFSHAELMDGIERFKGMRGVCQLRALAPLGDGRSESPGESVMRLRWIDSGLPKPEPQIDVRRNGVLVARLDLGNRQLLLAAEYDGLEWHSHPDQVAHDRARRAMLEREFGWLIIVVDRTNLFGSEQNCEALLRSGLAQARKRLGSRLV